ncbi:hypothetical protein CONLIGDRAFT_675934 [Coniochaeta ligniaria NRRL 30616]|uniref:ML-like domain-containing protein n=1 Tax=Coniochaeta ligniaria NRRL 30616 TaxID=1408157 RepID=A0A1J7J4F2_9PEZI|nr:hypothetical protein CONLIGDRAFT_675934 [Coniochaeta ligniaria NRRL 30616]
MALALLACLVLRPVTAAKVPFENCLPDSYRYNQPTLLQWLPYEVHASFDTENPSHTLRVTMWGNVTGSLYNVTLPPPNSTAWTDPTKLDGKILGEPDPDSDAPKLTTLHSKVEFLTYEPWSENTNFCNTSLTNATCPLGPVFNTSNILVPYDLPSVTMTHDFFSTYAFASLSATFLIIYGDSKSTNIGCVSATITPDLGDLAWMLKILPLIILLFVGFGTLFAGIFSPWGTSDIFHLTSNYGRDADLLRLVTPGFGDCLQYIQFVALTGGLTLSYPGFYQPIVSQASWSTLMFNESFVTKAPGWQNLMDGIYVTDAVYGLQEQAQLVGMANVEDIWAGMIIWLLVIIAAVLVLVQAGFAVQWVYRFVNNIQEQDLRAKNIPFSIGNVIRIVFNYFLLPIVALSTFQMVVASESPAYTVALAVITLVLIVGFAGWLLYLIASTKPRAFLYDDLPTLLLYGPLYNTYSDEAAAFALIPVLLTFLRGIAIGAVQPAGVAQLVILAICEVIQILTLHAFRPFHSPTSMNAYHTLFAAVRLVTVMMMIAFIPSLGVNEGAKGWIGYAILLAHAGVLVLGFLLNALQTIVEVIARMAGAGGDDVRGQTRGGLSKIFGMRQLSRRTSRRENGASRHSQLSSSAMLDTEEASKSGYVMPGGRIRSESAGSMGVLLQRQRTSSAMDVASLDAGVRNFDKASSFTPTTPGEASTFSFLPSPGIPGRQSTNALPLNPSDPFYRPPRRRTTLENQSPLGANRGSWASGDLSQRGGLGLLGGPADPAELGGDISRAATPAPYGQPNPNPVPRQDYSTREVDFYYGVRGERLNSDAPNRKLRTGPADPTKPIASATGWFRTLLGGKSKEKGKGFEVVRSSRMPPAMRARGGEFDDDPPPEGVPVAMGVLRHGPIDSDDEDDVKQSPKPAVLHSDNQQQPAERELLDADGSPRDDEYDDLETREQSDGPASFMDGGDGAGKSPYTDLPSVPQVPRKSSRRQSDGAEQHKRNLSLNLTVPGSSRGSNMGHSASASTSRLPFERTSSQKRLSSTSSINASDDFSQIDLQEPTAPYAHQPASFGHVSQGSISRVDRDGDLLGSSAEVVYARRSVSGSDSASHRHVTP